MFAIAYAKIRGHILENQYQRGELYRHEFEKIERSLEIQAIVFLIIEILVYAAIVGVALYSQYNKPELFSHNSIRNAKTRLGMIAGPIASLVSGILVWAGISLWQQVHLKIEVPAVSPELKKARADLAQAQSQISVLQQALAKRQAT